MRQSCRLPRGPVLIGAAGALHPGGHPSWIDVVAELLDRHGAPRAPASTLAEPHGRRALGSIVRADLHHGAPMCNLTRDRRQCTGRCLAMREVLHDEFLPLGRDSRFPCATAVLALRIVAPSHFGFTAARTTCLSRVFVRAESARACRVCPRSAAVWQVGTSASLSLDDH